MNYRFFLYITILIISSEKNAQTSLSILAKRDSNHHKNKEGYDKAELDKFSFDGDAIRGREQMLIEHFGGAKSEEGTSGNARNSISPRNNNEEKYRQAAIKIFGVISFLVAIIYLFGQS